MQSSSSIIKTLAKSKNIQPSNKSYNYLLGTTFENLILDKPTSLSDIKVEDIEKLQEMVIKFNESFGNLLSEKINQGNEYIININGNDIKAITDFETFENVYEIKTTVCEDVASCIKAIRTWKYDVQGKTYELAAKKPLFFLFQSKVFPYNNWKIKYTETMRLVAEKHYKKLSKVTEIKKYNEVIETQKVTHLVVETNIDVYNNEYFSASDICDFLSLKNVSQAMTRVSDENKYFITTADNNRKLCLNELGVFSLIVGSRKTNVMELIIFLKSFNSQAIEAPKSKQLEVTPIIKVENNCVSLFEIHKHLEIKTAFKDWSKRVLKNYTESVDFNWLKKEQVRFEGKREVVRNIIDYAVTIQVAKEISISQKTEKSDILRKYFITFESNNKNNLEIIKQKDLIISEMKEKVASFEKQLTHKEIKEYSISDYFRINNKPLPTLEEGTKMMEDLIEVIKLLKIDKKEGDKKRLVYDEEILKLYLKF